VGLVPSLQRLRSDAKELCELAIKNGASNVRLIKARQVIVDERVLLKCRYPPCMWYGQCLMCPPFTPSPEEFLKYLQKYRYAIIVQLEFPYPEELAKNIKSENVTLPDLFKTMGHKLENYIDESWMQLHKIVTTIEREAFNRGYYFATSFVATSCRLCEKCNPNMPCKHPFEARPSMESVGIDVYATAKKAGLETTFTPRERITLTGLVLID
jgi:predicted metal-binding protein